MMKAIFQDRVVPLYNKIVSKNFFSLCDSMVSADMKYKNAHEKKNIVFHEEKTDKGGRKTDSI